MNREEWLRCWGYVDGTPEADAAWAAKQAFRPRPAGFQIVGDIEPYRAVAEDIATGRPPVISSRADHREFLRRNGLAEVGNEKLKPREIPLSDPSGEVRRAYDKVLGT